MENKRLFVYWLGMVLGLTRQGRDIKTCELSKDEAVVEIVWENQSVQRINVECDSCMAILADVARALI